MTTTNLDRVLGAFAARRAGDGWSAKCPAHEDRNASLSISAGRNGGVVVKCHAGCAVEDVVAAAGLTMLDFAPEAPPRPARRRQVAVYQYQDEAGGLLFEVVRTEPKGFYQRAPGRKGISGIRRVLYRLPQLIDGVAAGADIYVVEGEKDVEALVRAGHVATTSPMGADSWHQVAELAARVLAGASVVIVADKDDAGRKHAAMVAASLGPVAGSITVVEARTGKDSADHLGAGHGVDDFVHVGPVDLAAPDRDGAGLEHPDDAGVGQDHDQEKVKTSVATTLVNLALDRYRLTASADGEPFAVPIDGPLLARPLRGSRGLRAELAAAYFHDTGKAASASALADALAVIEGRALAADRENASIRVAAHGDNVVIDLGNTWGDAVVIEPGYWKFEEGTAGGSPVLFRRTALTGMLPAPAGSNDQEMLGELERLRRLLNVTPRDWPVLVGWLVAALLPDIPHPVLLLTGEQGTGKSTAADLLVGLLDPSPAQLRSCPRDLEQWAVAAAGSWVVALDNVSSLTPWLSDALCRAVTGDGTVRRALYTDGDLSVLAFRRVIILTSIDAGSLRGDLAERLVAVELERIDPGRRRSDADLQAAYTASRPHILGGLYDLISRVLDVLPTVTLDTLPRMADFARVLAAVDQVTALGALDNYLATSKNLAASVIDDDPVAIALVALLGRNGGTWRGTSTELLNVLALPDRARNIPRSPQAITGWLTRITPGLRAAGISVDRDRGNRRRTMTISRAEGSREATSPTSPTSPGPADLHERGDEGGDVGVTRPPVALDHVTAPDTDHVTHVTPTSPEKRPLTCDDATGDEGDVDSHPLSHAWPKHHEDLWDDYEPEAATTTTRSTN